MKFREQPGKTERPPKAAVALGYETSPESRLDAKIGLPKSIESKLRRFLEFTDNDSWGTWLKQVEVASLLMTLFPGEMGTFRKQAPIEKLVDALPIIDEPEASIGMKNIKLVAPEQPFPIPEILFQPTLFNEPRNAWDDLIKLSIAAKIAILFPDRETENKKQAQGLFEELIGANRISVDLLTGLLFLLYLDPTLHKQIHEFVESQAAEFESMFKGIRTQGTDMIPTVVGRYFAAYKLCLADEIKQLPSGLLVAVEPVGVGRVTPLPERNTT